jgi:hypothetical protein
MTSTLTKTTMVPQSIDGATRRASLGWLFGAGGIGLRALATGLPASFLVRPLRAQAAEVCADKAAAQYLILSTSPAGDPMNANAPGTYDIPEIAHASDPAMAATPLKLGARTTKAAQVWSTLPAWVLERSAFIHHATQTNNHPNHPKVLRMMGAIEREEMAPSLYAKHIASCLGTVQTEPISAGAGATFTFAGKNLPNLRPTGLRDLLAKETGPLAKLRTIRDKSIDELHALLKDRGTAAQRAYLDNLALSRTQARGLSDDLLDMLAGIVNDRAEGQIAAAVALVKMNLAPVAIIRLDFGGDNHADAGLALREVPQHKTGVGHISLLMETLRTHGLEDKVTFAIYNVFGRTLAKKKLAGRDHWGAHHVTLTVGKKVRPGVIGGLVPNDARSDYIAGPFDSRTGAVMAGGGDIPADDGLASMGKTLGAMLGIPRATLDEKIKRGKVIDAALA